jgi:hypothetical protein
MDPHLRKESSMAERPSITEATRRVDEAEARLSVQDEILAVTEDFAHYVAERGRGITVATPARRLLRESIERIVLAFVQGAEEPSALDKRAEARVEEIVRQAVERSRTSSSSSDNGMVKIVVGDSPD